MVLMAACGGGDPGNRADPGPAAAAPPPPATGDTLRVEDARAVQVPGTGTGAAYFRVINPTERDLRLTTVTTPVARAAEVHETLEEDGLMRMVAFPEGMPVPAGTVVELRPGGKHVMLLALHDNLPAGDSIPMSLEFDSGDTLELTVPVQALGSGSS